MNCIKAFRFFSILIVSSLLFSLNLFAQANFSNELELKIDSIFENFNDINKPGATVAVVKNQKIVFKKGYGSANLEYGIPNSPSTIFHIASVSKQFTVFSILLLEKEGKLSFDDDIRKHIPQVPDFGKTITLRHLASHTSGMRDQWGLLGMAGWRQDDIITKEHILKLVFQQKELNFNPGESYMYCNTGFTLLAEVVARISGKTFAEFTEENIFKPLSMSNTLFYDDHEKIVKNRAYSYKTVKENVYKKSVLNYANVGATSLFTTVEDLALWSMNFSSYVVGNEYIFNKMNTLAVLNNGETFGGAYGQFINKYKGLNQIQHDGVDAGYRSYLGRFPDQNFSVMVFGNLGQSNPINLSLQVADLYLKDSFEKESDATITS
ncbi:serine hydrolase domain-containing protein [Kriegella aquimaris]|uniref:CubicO group peptidase, beta-lactamase class C family n=1 Tax=Kriegella aquimaris TaxID=192904 RepID=A0A1G9RNN9_9FLAO|nr:serine hydrolase domain-containing protein [Kriegella aquimaris]SDM24751.1 CubicO group peptidase, beta-lactamase class C family [Kriegella aquimaris]